MAAPPAHRAAELIALTSTKIHLWWAFSGQITDSRLLTSYRELLNAGEQAQEQRFYFARDRHRYLVTRAMVRTVLSRYLPIDPREWRFQTNLYGRPEITNAQAKAASLVFNISHTQGLIAMGVSRQRALGVDVENCLARPASMDIARHYFASEEVAALTATPAHQHQFRFFEYWTFKEAYIKARGMGLSLPLDKFAFNYPDDDSVDLAIAPELADNPSRWQLWQSRPAPEYLVAVCAERLRDTTPELIVRRCIPLLSEEKITPEFCRLSSPQQSRTGGLK